MMTERTDLANISKLRIKAVGEARTLAQAAMPNQHRMAKGDIVTCGLREWGPDVVNERATIPTAKARTRMLRITELRNEGIINDWQWNCCVRFKNYWQSSLGRSIAAMDYSKVKVDGQPFNFDRMVQCIRDFEKYSWLATRMRPRTSHILHAVVCHELSIEKGMRGDTHTKTVRFQLAAEELEQLLSEMRKEFERLGLRD